VLRAFDLARDAVQRIAQALGLTHKRFKSRPQGAPPLY